MLLRSKQNLTQAGSTDFPEIENTEIDDTEMKDVDYTREFDDIPVSCSNLFLFI